MDDNNVEYFVLRDGRYVMSPELSDKLFYISRMRPESFHKEDTGYSWDDSGMADLFAECYKNDTRYCPEAKSWYTFDGGVWRKDVEGLLLSAKVREFVRLMVLYCGEIIDDEKRKQYLQFVGKMGDRRFRERIMKDARDDMSISASEFDKNPYLINCKNGTYDLENHCFREHDWRNFLTMQTNFSYSVDTDVHCERWEHFITEVTQGDSDKADYLQRALGYSLLGSANEECMFILHGKTTRNGKSTLLSAIHHLLGDYAAVSPVSIICKSDRAKNAEAASPMLASLKGKRFVTMAESNQYGKLDEEMIKQLTGGEEIKARNLHEAPITFLPQFTLWLSCNDLPTVQDKSLFASDRVRVIEFNRHFKEEERDETLKQTFREDEVMRGIFSWLLRGYFRYKKLGLKMSSAMKTVVKQYEKDNDIVLQFLEEKCERGDVSTKAKTLYDAFKIWTRSNGYYTMSAKKFNANLETHPEWHDGKRISMGYAVFDGIKLRN